MIATEKIIKWQKKQNNKMDKIEDKESEEIPSLVTRSLLGLILLVYLIYKIDAYKEFIFLKWIFITSIILIIILIPYGLYHKMYNKTIYQYDNESKILKKIYKTRKGDQISRYDFSKIVQMQNRKNDKTDETAIWELILYNTEKQNILLAVNTNKEKIDQIMEKISFWTQVPILTGKTLHVGRGPINVKKLNKRQESQ